MTNNTHSRTYRGKRTPMKRERHSEISSVSCKGLTRVQKLSQALQILNGLSVPEATFPPTDADIAFAFVRQVVRDRIVASGETLTVRVELDAITASLVVGVTRGSEIARFQLDGDEFTAGMAYRRQQERVTAGGNKE